MAALINFYLTVRFLVIWLALIGDCLLMFECFLGIGYSIYEVCKDREWKISKEDLLVLLFFIILFLISLLFMTCAVTYDWKPTLPSIWANN